MKQHRTAVIEDILKLSAQQLIDRMIEVCHNRNIDINDTTVEIDPDVYMNKNYNVMIITEKTGYWPDEI